jgi:hypothetical protein
MTTENDNEPETENSVEGSDICFERIKGFWSRSWQFVTGRLLSPPETTFGWKPDIESERSLIAYLQWLNVRHDYELKRLRVWALGVVAFMLWRISQLVLVKVG